MLNGMLNIYKEAGYTSSDVVAKLRGILHMRKIGHTGTLDPMAEGVLPVCLGNGTKLASLIEDRDKEYRAVMRLGLATDTQDMTGQVLEEASPELLSSITEDMIREACASFIGDYDQIPPMYSAIKVQGKKLYELARAGKTVERKARRVKILDLEVEKIEMPLVTLRVVCSKGTYIRTLCEDAGRKMGCPAVMDSLLRTRVGSFSLEDARTLSQVEEAVKNAPGGAADIVRTVESFFSEAPYIRVNEENFRYLRNGNPLYRNQLLPEYASARPAQEGQYRVCDHEGNFYGIYRWSREDKRYDPVRMFIPQD